MAPRGLGPGRCDSGGPDFLGSKNPDAPSRPACEDLHTDASPVWNWPSDTCRTRAAWCSTSSPASSPGLSVARPAEWGPSVRRSPSRSDRARTPQAGTPRPVSATRKCAVHPRTQRCRQMHEDGTDDIQRVVRGVEIPKVDGPRAQLQAPLASEPLRLLHPDLALVHREDIQPAGGQEQCVPAFPRAYVERTSALWESIDHLREEVVGLLPICKVIAGVA